MGKAKEIKSRAKFRQFKTNVKSVKYHPKPLEIKYFICVLQGALVLTTPW